MCSKVSLVVICKFLIISAEVITLIKDNELKCVLTEESLNFPVLVTNHDCLEFKRKRTLLKLDDNSDWKVSQDIDMFEVKSDIRLADIEPNHTTSLLLKNSTFFICVNKHFKLEIRNEIHDTLGTINVERETSDNQSCEWRLCKLLFLRNNNTVVLQKCGTYSKSFNETKLWIEFQERPQFYIPEYYYSNKINENNTSIHLNSSDCVSMFVSVDEGCILEIYINNNLTQIEGFNKKGQLKTWKLQKILTNGAKVMTINRTSKESNKTEGFWGIYQIRECQLNNIEIINTTCKNITNETRCEPYNKETKVSSRIWNKPYYLANKSCEQILGSTYKHCENHKICFGDKCQCAWGFEGPNCNKTCKEPNYGLDCEEIYFRPFFNSNNSNINVYLNLTHIRISWLFPSLHFIEYSCESKFCKTTDAKEVSTKNKTIYVKNQAFEICEVTFLTQNKTQLEKINFDATTNFPIQNSEIPNLEIDISGISVRFNKCENFQGALNYSIKYKCLNGTCNNKTESFLIELRDSYKESFKINTTLELETSYEFNVTAWRQEENESKKINITCKPGVPYPLRYLSLYDSNSQNISIRWMEPYPLTGRIEKYYFRFEKIASFEKKTNTSKNSNEPTFTFRIENILIWYNYLSGIFKPRTKTNSLNTFGEINWTKCKLWENFFCGDLPRPTNSSDSNFTIHVYYKYFNGANLSNSTKLILSKLDNFTNAPENIRVKCSTRKPSEIVLEWEHPSYTHGKFDIFNITLKNSTNKKYINKQIKKYEKKYNQTITVNKNEDLEIAIQVANGTSEVATVSVFGISISNNLYLHYFSKGIYYLSVPKNNETCKMIKNDFELNCNLCESETDTYFCKVKSKIKNKSSTTWKAKATTIASQTVTITKGSDKNIINTKSTTHNFNKEEKEKKNDDTSLKNLVMDNSKIATVTISVTVVILGVIGISLIFCFCKKKKQIRIDNSTKPIKLSELVLMEELNSLIEETNNPKQNKNAHHIISIKSKPIKLEDFEKYLLNCLQDNPDVNPITIQYEQIALKNAFKPSECGKSSENAPKNRYRNVIPYDDTRVVLKNNEDGDYINANYVNGYQAPKAFIATQAPLPLTIYDFWQMIIQDEVQVIIMLTELKENGRVKSEKYWPNHQSLYRCGDFLIHSLSSRINPNYIHQELKVISDKKTHIVQHYQYVSWPDHGIPPYVSEFTSFIKEVMKIPQHRPTVVHCNAGCGRTGTFILCDIAIRMAMDKNEADFFKILSQLREQRCNMVNNVEQYIFAHFVLSDYFFGKDFSIPVSEDFQTDVQKALEDSSLNNLIQCLEAARKQYEKEQAKLEKQLTDEEKAKNRYSSILPGQSQIFLPTSSANPSNYINAITVDCYRYPKKFIVTQQPLPNTVEDLWKLVEEYGINTVLSLNEFLPSDPRCPRFWPTSKKDPWTLQNGNTLSFVSQNKNNSAYNMIRVKLFQKENKRLVNIIEMKNWKREDSTPNISDLISVWKKTMTSKNQIVVTCYDGATASGLFVALAYLFEKLNMDHSCDVFSAIKTLRQSRTQFVEKREQIVFLYQAALEYVKEFSAYGNFS